jgi:arginine-tRNA-protein transferase
VRVQAAAFRPNRRQRRCWNRHQGLSILRRDLAFDAEHFDLYLRYQRRRHPGGGMDEDSRDQYRHFLLHSNVTTELLEFREGGVLRMVSLVDRLSDGFSSVYTFFEPDMPGSSFGTFSVLSQVQRCVDAGLPYLYLGYWIAQSPKMAYKASFSPIEGLIEGAWKVVAERLDG